MLDSPLSFVSKKVEAQTVLRGISFCNRTGSKDYPLCCIHKTLEDRILHSLAMIFAQPGYSTQLAAASLIVSAHIVTDKDHHESYLQKKSG